MQRKPALLAVVILYTFFTILNAQIKSEKWNPVEVGHFDSSTNCSVRLTFLNKTAVSSDINQTVREFEYTLVDDPCNRPHERKFMHCNTNTSKCECYRLWPRGVPEYDKLKNQTISEKTVPEWFRWNEVAQECLIMEDMKCGLVDMVPPYRCEGEGKCIERREEDPFHLYCSSSNINTAATPQTSTLTISWAFSVFCFYLSYFQLSALRLFTI